MSEVRTTPLPARRLLKISEAASYCGMSANHFKAHVRVAPLKFGGSLRYDRVAIDKWLDNLGNPTPPTTGRGLGNARQQNSAH